MRFTKEYPKQEQKRFFFKKKTEFPQIIEDFRPWGIIILVFSLHAKSHIVVLDCISMVEIIL